MRRHPAARRAAFIAAAAAPLAWLSMAPAGAALSHPEESQHHATVGDSAEAWYSASPVDICTTPLGCPPTQVPSSPYPADTLHVGVAAGQETARTYVLPNLLEVPFDATDFNGTMTLPVTTDSSAGTVAPESAHIQACLATAPVTDGTQGSSQAPPKVDCKTKAPLKYDAKKAVFTLDLSTFFAAWDAGKPRLGIGLLPAGAGPTDTWHVSFNGRKYKGDHITSALTFAVPPPIDTSTSVPPPAAPAPPTTTPVTPPSVSLPPPTTATPPAAAPQVAPTQPQPIAQPVAVSNEFQYPMAFLMPLALLAGAVFFIRLFTRDPTPMRATR